MKKIISSLAFMVGLVANADVLYWMVDTTSSNDYADKYTAIALKDDGGNTLDTIAATQSQLQGLADAGGYFTYAFDATPAFSESASYFVELLNGSTFVAESAKITGAELLAAGSFIRMGSITPARGPASFGTYNVPEPTSGLLFLVGGMLLGLKRRRQQV